MLVEGSLKAMQLKDGGFEGQLIVAQDLGKLKVSSSADFCAGGMVFVDGRLTKTNIAACQTDNGGSPSGIVASDFGTLRIGSWTPDPANLPFTEGDLTVMQLTI